LLLFFKKEGLPFFHVGGIGTMPYRSLLLPLTADPSGEAALASALMLAKQYAAHLSCLIVRVDSRDVAPLAGEGLSGAMIEDMMQATEAESRQAAEAASALFARLAAAHGVAVAAPGTPPAGSALASLTTLVGREEELVPARARVSDLTIVPHPAREQDAAASDSLHAVLFDSGRPVLIAPPTPPEAIGRRCAIAWNGSHQASAALGAILPWLKQADAVRVLHAAEYQRQDPQAADVLPYLAMHGIEADVVEFPVDRGHVGAGLLAAAQSFGADLLGMGAYAHSRLRQAILGGVTRHVLGNATLPVLMGR
jgi:nucleotide-binding universal stress UspA family protein